MGRHRWGGNSFVIAISIHVPRRGNTVNAAIADHVPVAELIPHLVEDLSPGEHWVFRRAVGDIRPEHSLSEAGVLPGEILTLDVATAPAPPESAIEELSGPVAESPAAWVVAALASLISWHAAPLWSPIDFHDPRLWSAWEVAAVLASALVALGLAAASVRDARWSYIAPIVAFGAGLNVNVAAACACAVLVVWRPGPPRIVTATLLAGALINSTPSLTLLIALIALTYSGQVAIGIARVQLPRVPATGIFSPPVHSSAGTAVQTHSALVVGLCVVIAACVVQIAPWGVELSGWTIALLVALGLMGASARGTRPVHATAVASLAGFIGLWLAVHHPAGIALLALTALPAVKISSPMIGRVIYWVEMLAFAAAVPLAIHATGVFEAMRGIG